MRKGIVFLFAVLFVLGGVASAFAQVIADTTTKGSILIYPKIDVTYDKDTIVWISNDGNNATPLNIECYYVNGANYVGSDPAGAQNFTDFEINLTANQEFNFSAAQGGYTVNTQAPAFTGANYEGFLACVAVQTTGQGVTQLEPLYWNYLYGKAWVIDYKNNTAYSYPAWSFRALTGTSGQPIPTSVNWGPGIQPGLANNGTPNVGLKLPLDGITYSACPGILNFDFPLEGYEPGFPYYGTNDLTLLPCQQDLRESHIITHTKFQFTVYNTFETEFSNVWGCSNCWFDHFLNEANAALVLNYFGKNGAFSAANSLGNFPFTDSTETAFAAGRFRVASVADNPTCGFPTTGPAQSVSTGLIGVLVSYIPKYVPSWWHDNTITTDYTKVFAFSSNGAHGLTVGPTPGFLEIDLYASSQGDSGAKKKK